MAGGDELKRAIAVCLVFLSARAGVAAADRYGRVTVGGVPVPGATVTAARADVQGITTTDVDGLYRLADVADGVWTIRVEMLGFATVSQDLAIGPDSPPAIWELTLLPFAEIARGVAVVATEPVDTVRAPLI